MARTQQYEELLWKLFNEMRTIASRRAGQIAEMPRETFLKLYEALKKKSDRLDQEADTAYQETLTLGRQVREGATLKIEVESSEIRFAKASSRVRPINGKAIFRRQGIEIKTDCVVACGHWDRLGELKQPKINVLDYLPALLPPARTGQDKPPLGLVTFQNGMMNKVMEFRSVAAAIINQFPEGPLCIGLHNPTTRFIFLDLNRFNNEPEFNPVGVYSFYQMVKTLAEQIPAINSDLIWTHFAHSEAGLIAHVVLDLLAEARQAKLMDFLKKHLVIATYGAVKPIPKGVVLQAFNTYSNQDIVLFLAKQYLDRAIDKMMQEEYVSNKFHKGKTYQVTVVSSLTPRKIPRNLSGEMPKALSVKEHLEMSWLERLAHVKEFQDLSMISERTLAKGVDLAYGMEDHAFLSQTYQAALSKNVDDLKDSFRVFDAKKIR